MKLKKEIRRMTEAKSRFTCDICGKLVANAGRYQHRSAQFVSDHIPRLLTNVCRTCIYRESFGSKVVAAKKRNQVIENESQLYADID